MGINSLVSDAIGIVEEHPIGTAVAIGTAAVGAGIIGLAVSGRKSKSGTRRTHTKRGWKQDRARFNKSQKWEVAYRKHKKRMKKTKKRSGKVYYAKKTGQPYILKANGQAKFIKGKRRKR